MFYLPLPVKSKIVLVGKGDSTLKLKADIFGVQRK